MIPIMIERADNIFLYRHYVFICSLIWFSGDSLYDDSSAENFFLAFAASVSLSDLEQKTFIGGARHVKALTANPSGVS